MSIVTVAGNVTKDAELKFTASGTPLLSFSVADNIGWGDKKHTVFYNCSLFGKRAEALHPHIKKGMAVTVTGELDRRDWESNGKSGTSLDVRIDHVTLQGGRNQNDDAQGGFRSNAPAQQTPLGSGGGDFADDDIPF